MYMCMFMCIPTYIPKSLNIILSVDTILVHIILLTCVKFHQQLGGAIEVMYLGRVPSTKL